MVFLILVPQMNNIWEGILNAIGKKSPTSFVFLPGIAENFHDWFDRIDFAWEKIGDCYGGLGR